MPNDRYKPAATVGDMARLFRSGQKPDLENRLAAVLTPDASPQDAANMLGVQVAEVLAVAYSAPKRFLVREGKIRKL